MSTYSGDAQIVDVLTASGSRTTGGTTILHTVAAGRFAEVQLMQSSGESFASASASCYIGTFIVFSLSGMGSDAKSAFDLGYPIIVDSGNTIRIVTGNSGIASMSVAIKEFNKP